MIDAEFYRVVSHTQVRRERGVEGVSYHGPRDV